MEDLPELLTWDDVTSYEDLLTPREIEIIEQLEKDYPASQHCPYLKKEGDHYHYCGARSVPHVEKIRVTDNPSPTDPIYTTHIGIMELQLWCLDGKERYEKCNFYPPKNMNKNPYNTSQYLISMYNLQLNQAIKSIKESKAKNVLIQIPDGLKPRATEIAEYLENNTKANITIWADSCWGVCDTPVGINNLNFDLLLQFGHSTSLKPQPGGQVITIK